MLRKMFWMASTLLAVLVPSLGRLTAADLHVGDSAPDFTLPGSDGKTYHLADFKGKQAVVLAWFPKAFTPGCTAECKSFAAGGKDLRKFDVAYFTASCDTAEYNKKFAESVKADYPILADPSRKVATEYGVVDGLRKVPQRWTFYIGTDGNILAIDKTVKTATHAADVAAKLKTLGVAEKK